MVTKMKVQKISEEKDTILSDQIRCMAKHIALLIIKIKDFCFVVTFHIENKRTITTG